MVARRDAQLAPSEFLLLRLELSSAKPFCPPVSCAALDDAVNPAALLLGRGEGEAELLFEGSREDATHGVALPARRTRYLIDRHTFGSTQHRDDPIMFRGALRLGLSLRGGQHLHRRPQFVDQCVAIGDLPALLNTGESIPYCQEPLPAKL